MIHEVLKHYEKLFVHLDEVLNQDDAFNVFKQIADTYGPTLSARYTRGRVVKNILEDWSSRGVLGSNIELDLNYKNTGNVCINLGSQSSKPIWSFAHLDNISYLTGPINNGIYPLTRFHEPRIVPGERKGIALVYDDKSQSLIPGAEGIIVTDENNNCSFKSDVHDLPLSSRVVFQTEATLDGSTGMVYGSVDDAFGCAALVLSAIALSAFDVEALIVLSDEEEGVVGVGNTGFARGSRRLISKTELQDLPPIMSVTDLHEVKPLLNESGDVVEVTGCGDGSLFAGFASGTRGGVTPPHVLAAMRELSSVLDGKDIRMRENESYVSRSDCVSAMMSTQNVILLGFPGAYSHFEKTPRAHIADLLNLSKSHAVLTAVSQSLSWRKHYQMN
ncbi:MAG TPA: hypothetical protein DCL76_02460 [Chloroflexi bacterium]|nr:hypothetical protein [Chloroflexota bacterium]